MNENRCMRMKRKKMKCGGGEIGKGRSMKTVKKDKCKLRKKKKNNKEKSE